MKSFLRTILLASVVTLYTFVGGAETPTTPADSAGNLFKGFSSQTLKAQYNDCVDSLGDKPANRQRCSIKVFGESQCDQIKKTMNSLKGDAITACQLSKQGTDVDTCKKAAQDCADADDEEADSSAEQKDAMSGILSGMGISFPDSPKMDGSKYRGQCLSDKNFREEKTSVKKDLESAQKLVTQSKKEQTKAAKEAIDKQTELTEKFQKLKAESAEKTRDQQDNQRKTAEQQAQDAIQAQQNLGTLRSNVLKQQGALAQAIGNRTRLLMKLTDAMIRKDCMETLEKIRAAELKLRVGSANSLIQQSGEKQKRRDLEYNSCLDQAKSLREETRVSSQAQIDAAQNDISGSNAQIAKMNDSIALHASNMAALQAQQAQQTQTDATDTQNKLMSVYTQMTQSTSQAQKESAQIDEDLAAAKKDMTKASNELATLGNKSAGEKSPNEAIAAITKYNSAVTECKSLGCDEKSFCDGQTSSSDKSSGSGSKTPTTKSGTDRSTTDND